jgi:hypothetical protein
MVDLKNFSFYFSLKQHRNSSWKPGLLKQRLKKPSSRMRRSL